MSKNFVREIDGIKNINKQEFYTNKANDLLSTKEHNYIRKETQEYHCLTDNVKQTKATNVRYTDTTAKPNVNYNLLSVDNSQVPKTNTNTISALSLVSALEAKDQQLQELKDEIASLKEKQPLFHYIADFAGNQRFYMETLQTDNFSKYEITTRINYRLTLPAGSNTRNFANVLENGACNFVYNKDKVTMKYYFVMNGAEDITVSIDEAGSGLDFTVSSHTNDFVTGEVFIKFLVAKDL